MKVQVNEFDQAFNIQLVAENLQDAAWLVRWNINAKKEVLRSMNTFNGGSFNGSVSWQKRADYTSEIKRGIK
jgi:hypothetical protein